MQFAVFFPWGAVPWSLLQSPLTISVLPWLCRLCSPRRTNRIRQSKHCAALSQQCWLIARVTKGKVNVSFHLVDILRFHLFFLFSKNPYVVFPFWEIEIALTLQQRLFYFIRINREVCMNSRSLTLTWVIFATLSVVKEEELFELTGKPVFVVVFYHKSF